MADVTAFVDESYTQRAYLLAAVVCDPGQAASITQGFAAVADHVRRKWDAGPGIEFHAHPMMQAAGPWSFRAGQHHEADSIFRHLLRAVASSGAAVIVEGVDPVRLRKRYRYPDSPHDVVLRHILERVDDHCRDAGGLRCQVVCDDLGAGGSRGRDAAVAAFAAAATPGHGNGRLAFIDQPITWADSSSSTGIQAADLVAYIARRRFHHDGGGRANRAAKSLWSQIEPAVEHIRMWLP